MRPLLLVRHPPPMVEPGVPADQWGLGASGVRSALAMGDHVPPGTTAMLSSTAPVAAQTARAIAGTAAGEVAVLLDDRLREVAGAAAAFGDPEAIEHYLDGESIEGWESPRAAVARLSSALLVARQRNVRATVVVTHGILLALWLAPRLAVPPGRLWRQLTMPDLWWYDPATNAVSRVPLRQRVATPQQFVG